MNDAEKLKRLAEIDRRLCDLVEQKHEILQEMDRLKAEASAIEINLWNSLKQRDVYASGNAGHEARRLGWLKTLARDFRDIFAQNAAEVTKERGSSDAATPES